MPFKARGSGNYASPCITCTILQRILLLYRLQILSLHLSCCTTMKSLFSNNLRWSTFLSGSLCICTQWTKKRAACSPMLLRYVPFIAWAVRHLRHWCTPHRGFWSAGKYCAPPNSLGTCTACMKLLGKNSRVSMWLWKVKGKGCMRNRQFSTNISLYFKNGTAYGPITTADDE